MCVTNLSKVVLDSAAAGIEPAISSRKSNAITTTPPSHRTVDALYAFPIHFQEYMLQQETWIFLF